MTMKMMSNTSMTSASGVTLMLLLSAPVFDSIPIVIPPCDQWRRVVSSRSFWPCSR